MKLPQLFISVTLLLFIGCDVASFTEKEYNSISKYKVTITISDFDGEKKLNRIKVDLSNGKKKIVNDNIHILVNDIPLELFTKQNLYYGTTSFYKRDTLSRKSSYYFEMILPDSTRYPLAFIKPLPESKNTLFEFPTKLNTSEDFVLQWTNMYKAHQIDIIKGTEVKIKEAANITEYGYADRIIDTLNSKTGEYILPKSYFEDSLNFARSIEIAIKREETGLINPILHKNSSLTYTYVIEKYLK